MKTLLVLMLVANASFLVLSGLTSVPRHGPVPTMPANPPAHSPTHPPTHPPAPSLFTLPLTYKQNETVHLGSGLVHKVVKAQYGGGEEKAHPCMGFCHPKDPPCSTFVDVNASVEIRGLTVGKEALGDGPCKANEQVLKLVVQTSEPIPIYDTSECNNHPVSTGIGPEGYRPVCHCGFAHRGPRCGECRVGLVDYPRCVAPPYVMDIVDTPPQGACPRLLERKCDLKNFPRAMLQRKTHNSFLNVLGCGVSALPWGCQLAAHPNPAVPKPEIKSICTIVAGNIAWLHLLLLLESVRIFAPNTPFIIGIDKAQEHMIGPGIQELQDRGAMVQIMVLYKSMESWFHEKPKMMKLALERYENTLWVDTDCVLVAELPTPPASTLGTLGVALHDPRAMTPLGIHAVGYTNTGVVYATRGSPLLDNWLDAMIRFDHSGTQEEEWQGMDKLFVDQGPMDYVMTTAPGAFKIDPQWNVWWFEPNAETGAMMDLSSDGRHLTFDDAPARIIHSHFVAEEKNFGAQDRGFNTMIRDLLNRANPESPLGKFAKRFKLYATHVVNPDKASLPFPGTPEFDHLLKEWASQGAP